MSGQNAQLHVVMEKEQELEVVQLDAKIFKLMTQLTIYMRLKLATYLHVSNKFANSDVIIIWF